MDMDGDWRLPRPNTLFRTVRTRQLSIAAMFSVLTAPVVTEAVQRAQALSTESDAEGFHQLRVAFRKLRALFWAYEPYLGAQATSHVTEELKRLAALAGATRDWDIAIDLLKAAQTSNASIDLLVIAAHEKRACAVAHSRTMIEHGAIAAFLDDVVFRAQDILQTRYSGIRIRTFANARVDVARRALRKRCERVACSGESAQEEALHNVRKAGKRLRYLLEFFQPVIEGGHDRRIAELTSMQNKLGHFNDLAASELLIRNTTFDDVPQEVIDASLQWLNEQKDRSMRAAVQKLSRY